MIDNYFIGSNFKSQQGKEVNKQKVKFLEKLTILTKSLSVELLDSEYKNAHHVHVWRCMNCNDNFKKRWNDIQQGYGCDKCKPPKNRSKYEDEIITFLNELGFNNIEMNNRSILEGKELDIYLPEKNFAIEFCGLYWHSEIRSTTPNGHYEKLEKSLLKGIQLIHIFEDEWINKRVIIEEKIKNLLFKSEGSKVNARSCSVHVIETSTKTKFLDIYHIHGPDQSTVKLGLYHDSDLVAIMTFGLGNISKGSKQENGIWEISRFCCDYHYMVRGAFGKLLSYFKNNYEWKKIFSYCDRRWSTGSSYEKLGFQLEGISKPNYWYYNPNLGCKRIHRYSLRKNENDPKDIPEHKIRNAQGYYRIWDCGHYKFSLLNDKNIVLETKKDPIESKKEVFIPREVYTEKTCRICGLEFKSLTGLSRHLCQKHKDVNLEEYYTKYIDPNNKCQKRDCDNICKVISFQKGYHQYCSVSCASLDRDKSHLSAAGASKKRIDSYKETYSNRRKEKKLLLKESIDINNKSQCQICGKIFDSIISLGRHIGIHDFIVKQYYDKFYRQQEDGVCKYCHSEKETTFDTLNRGYRRFHEGCAGAHSSKLQTKS